MKVLVHSCSADWAAFSSRERALFLGTISHKDQCHRIGPSVVDNVLQFVDSGKEWDSDSVNSSQKQTEVVEGSLIQLCGFSGWTDFSDYIRRASTRIETTDDMLRMSQNTAWECRSKAYEEEMTMMSNDERRKYILLKAIKNLCSTERW